MDSELSCETRVEEFLAAVGDDPLHAWEAVEPELLRARARELDALAPHERRRLPLFGVLIGVKDIFDTRDLPTAYGSPIYAGHRAAADARAVARLRDAGAVVAGKTTLAEFAAMHPPNTLSPIDRERTPGGSSTGSAVAVAVGHVPLATGTQTAGSINRPASYCAVIGFKPTFGLLPVDGVKPIAPTLDTVGVLGRDLDQVARCTGVMAGRAWSAGEPPPEPPRLGFARTPLWEQVEPEARAALQELAGRVGAEELELPAWFSELVAAQSTIQLYETARSLAQEYDEHADQLSDVLRDYIAAGAALRAAAWEEAIRVRDDLGPDLNSLLQQFDGVLTPSTTGVPPLGTSATGDPLFSRAWTLIGSPSISLPLVWTESPRLPVGLQLVGAAHTDERLLGTAAAVLDAHPPPATGG